MKYDDINVNRIISALAECRSVRIAVAGDFCLDKYLYIDAALDEPSLETGLTAYQVTRRALFAGAAGTISNNLASLGVEVAAVGFIGDDGEGYELSKALRGINADTSLLRVTPLIATPTYMKPIYCDGNAKREINRLDIRNFSETPDSLSDAFIADIRTAFSSCDAMIICDQFVERNCSAVTDRVRSALSGIADEYPDKLMLADSRGFIDEFRGVTVKCNDTEAARSLGFQDYTDDGVIAECGKRLVERNGRPAIITRGSRGAACFEKGAAVSVPGFVVDGEIDICGAGDSFNAGFALGSALGLTMGEAALLANAVASITIQQIGVTGCATRLQLSERLSGGVLRK